MTQYFNDSPIETVMDDRYGVAPFAKSIATSIVNMAKPVGTTIALNGPWGSGKSSVVNLIRNALPPEDKSDLVVTEFKCWWYKGEEALALAFLQNLNAVLREGLGDTVKDLIPDITRGLLQAGPVVGQAISVISGHPWLAGAIGKGSNFLKTFFPEGKTVEKSFRKLSKILDGQDRRFLVIIDDIDRLSPDEALAIFRLVKSVGRLPNVLYLLVFDRELADKAVAERYPSEGPHFLEKIVQASFEIPQPLPTDLNGAVLAAVQKICGNPPADQVTRIMNLFYDVVAPTMKTPRHVVRFENAISVTWPAVSDEVSLADFLALEAIRLYEPGLFRTIRDSKKRLLGGREQGDPSHNDAKGLDPFLMDVPESRRGMARVALQRLFPRLEASYYGAEWGRQWDQERRICVEKHFDTYFRLSLGEGRISHDEIANLINRAEDKAFIQETLRRAATVERRNGQSMVPVYLDELTVHASQIPVGKIGALLTAFFEIQDEIDLDRDEDKGFMGMASTSLRYHWLIRALTRGRTGLDERSEMYTSALVTASPSWHADFAISASDQYRPRENRRVAPDDYLIHENAVEVVRAGALSKMRMAAADGSLLKRRKLGYALYEWQDLAGGPAEVRAWTDGQLSNDAALVALARTFTGQSWSAGMGMFGLGDRVATPQTHATIDAAADILDFPAFKSRLEQLDHEATLPSDDLVTIKAFLGASPMRKRGQRIDDEDD